MTSGRPPRATPANSPGGFAYRRQCVLLSEGDTLVLMSDGFPELFRATGEMLGYEGAVEAVRTAVGRSAEEVIGQLRGVAEAWSDGRAQDDDLTFLVMKVKVERGRVTEASAVTKGTTVFSEA